MQNKFFSEEHYNIVSEKLDENIKNIIYMFTCIDYFSYQLKVRNDTGISKRKFYSIKNAFIYYMICISKPYNVGDSSTHPFKFALHGIQKSCKKLIYDMSFIIDNKSYNVRIAADGILNKVLADFCNDIGFIEYDMIPDIIPYMDMNLNNSIIYNYDTFIEWCGMRQWFFMEPLSYFNKVDLLIDIYKDFYYYIASLHYTKLAYWLKYRVYRMHGGIQYADIKSSDITKAFSDTSIEWKDLDICTDMNKKNLYWIYEDTQVDSTPVKNKEYNFVCSCESKEEAKAIMHIYNYIKKLNHKNTRYFMFNSNKHVNICK